MKHPHIIAVVNQKGGTGKSASAHNLGTTLARQGEKVLIIDLDSQAKLTMCMGYDQPDNLPCTIAHLLKGLIEETFSFQQRRLYSSRRRMRHYSFIHPTVGNRTIAGECHVP